MFKTNDINDDDIATYDLFNNLQMKFRQNDK